MRIDPEFEGVIGKQKTSEFEQLEKNILQLGRITDPLKTWHGFIVDGHHRWRIYQNHKDKLPEPSVVSLDDDLPNDKYAVIVWICQNQVGQHNLNTDELADILFRANEAQKHIHTGNQYTAKLEAGENAGFQEGMRRASKDGTVREIAEKFNMPVGKTSHLIRYGRARDTAEKLHPGFKKGMETGEIKATRAQVLEIRRLPEEERKEAVERIANGEPSAPNAKKSVTGNRKAAHERDAAIEAAINRLTNPGAVPEYTADNLLEEVEINSKSFVSLMRKILSERSTLLDQDGMRQKIENIITVEVQKILEVVNERI